MPSFILALAIFFLSLGASAEELSLNEFSGVYGTYYFHGRICSRVKCNSPQFYRKHFVQMIPGQEVMTLKFAQDLESPKPFQEMQIPNHFFRYYKQEEIAPHEGFELNIQGEPKKLSEKIKNGKTTTLLAIPTYAIRIIKFKQKKTDEKFDFGVEFIPGRITRQVVRDRNGQVISDEVKKFDAQEIQNQYLVGREALPPNF